MLHGLLHRFCHFSATIPAVYVKSPLLRLKVRGAVGIAKVESREGGVGENSEITKSLLASMIDTWYLVSCTCPRGTYP